MNSDILSLVYIDDSNEPQSLIDDLFNIETETDNFNENCDPNDSLPDPEFNSTSADDEALDTPRSPDDYRNMPCKEWTTNCKDIGPALILVSFRCNDEGLDTLQESPSVVIQRSKIMITPADSISDRAGNTRTLLLEELSNEPPAELLDSTEAQNLATKLDDFRDSITDDSISREIYDFLAQQHNK